MWVSILFTFLPAFPKDPKDAVAHRTYVGTFVGAQAIVGLIYTCAGLCKLIGTYYDWDGGITWFHPDGLSLHIAGNWHRSKLTILGPQIIQYPWLATVMNTGAVYLELFAVTAMLRPHMQRIWGAALIMMHFGILHAMKISFAHGVMVLLIMIVFSPVAATTFQLRPVLRELPLFGILVRLFDPPPATDTGMGLAPKGVLRRWWVPVVLVSYLCVSFSRFDQKNGHFRQELFPFSAMPMFSRMKYREQPRLAKLRKHFAKSPARIFAERKAKQPKSKKKPRR